jgi:2-oxoglutarate ferredoxin oxidoreductase subunit gamma
LSIDNKKEIRIAGLGGQGVVFAAQLLGRAGVLEGWCVSQSSFYGPESRGTLCYADVVLSRKSIDFPFVTKPDILIALSQEGYDKFGGIVTPPAPLNKGGAEGEGSVFYDSGRVRPDPSLKVEHFPVPAEEVAERELGKKMAANLIILAACCARTGIVSKESLIKALEEVTESASGGQRVANAKALELGWEQGTKAV